MKRTICILAGAILLSFVLAPAASAHKVTIFAWAEGEMVHTESKFSGGKRVMDGKIEVFDPAGTLLLEGRTDDKGEFSFKTPRASDLKIVLTAGMGHQSSWTITAAELGGGADEPVPSAPPVPGTEPAFVPAVAQGLTAQDVEMIVARQLEVKIGPLTRMVADLQDKGPTLSDVFGGIGYILGLVGLGAYMHYRRVTRGS